MYSQQLATLNRLLTLISLHTSSPFISTCVQHSFHQVGFAIISIFLIHTHTESCLVLKRGDPEMPDISKQKNPTSTRGLVKKSQNTSWKSASTLQAQVQAQASPRPSNAKQPYQLCDSSDDLHSCTRAVPCQHLSPIGARPSLRQPSEMFLVVSGLPTWIFWKNAPQLVACCMHVVKDLAQVLLRLANVWD